MKYRGKHIYRMLGIFITWGFLCLSCTSEDIAGEVGKPTEPEILSEAYLSVMAGMDESLKTRAGSENLGLREERHVTSVRIVLYDGKVDKSADPKVMYAFNLNIQSNSGGTGYIGSNTELYQSLNDREFITYGQRVARQKYWMLVIINPVYTVKSLTEVGNRLSQFLNETSISKDALTAAGNVAQNNFFLMTNHQDLVEVEVSQLKETIDEANAAPVSVKVDRMVAKVMVDKKTGSDFSVYPAGAQVRNFTWELDVTNKKAYWMRKKTFMMNGAAEVIGASRDYIYAEDPNFSGNGIGNTPEDEIQRNENFNYIAKIDKYPLLAKKLLSDATASAAEKYEYTLENTMATDEQVSEVMTRVVVRCQYAPPGFNFDESYYLYNNAVISQADMLFYRTAEDGLIPTALSGIKAAIANVEANNSFSIANPPSASYESYAIKYFYQGYSYYKIPIRHFDVALSDPLSYGYYGVVRNNSYTLSIASITGPGSVNVDGPGPFMSAGVSVVPWGVVTDKEEIGNPMASVVTYNYYYQNANRTTFTFLGSEYVTNVPVGGPFPSFTLEMLTARHSMIPASVGGSAAFNLGRVTFGSFNTTVSMDYTQNVFDIYYDLK